MPNNPGDTVMNDMIERARQLAFAGDFSPDDLGGDIGTMSLRNPDGPALFAIIEAALTPTVPDDELVQRGPPDLLSASHRKSSRNSAL